MAARGVVVEGFVVGRCEYDRVGGVRGGSVRCKSIGKDRQCGVRAQSGAGAARDDPFGAALLGALGRGAVPHLDEQRDPIALSERLTQPSVGHGGGW